MSPRDVRGWLPQWLVALILLSGCAEEGGLSAGDAPVPTPRIYELGAYSVAVGDELPFLGDGFIAAADGYTEVTFRGAYRHDGLEEPVHLTIAVQSVDDGTVLWPRFGPYDIPFARSGNVLGTFDGEVYATNVSHDGRTERQSEPSGRFLLEVEPSLVIRGLRAEGDAFSADCALPSTRLVNFVPYHLQVEAVGFEPETYVYTVGAGLLEDDEARREATVVAHDSASAIDNLGLDEPLSFAEVPASVAAYATSVSVDVHGTDGRIYTRLIPLTVYQPIFVRYVGAVEIAEIMEPEPISACMSGGVTGRDVSYSETTSDTRTISASRTLTEGWTDSYTEQHTSSYGGSDSQSNRVGFSTTDSEHYSWNVHGEVMVGAEGGFGPFARAKAELRVGAGREWGGSTATTSSSESAWTNTTTYSEAVSLAEEHQQSISEAMSESWSVSSTTSESLNYRAFLIPQHYGVFYRQTTRMIRRGNIIALDLCGNETVVGQFTVSDYAWAPDLAVSTECPPLPESTLPEAQCLVSPCEEVAP